MKSEKPTIQCPQCGGKALNRYGRIKTGQQRFKCLVCAREFTPHTVRFEVKDRPLCPMCGKEMHLYKRSLMLQRFRCSAYPKCRTYKRIEKGEENHELLLAPCTGPA